MILTVNDCITIVNSTESKDFIRRALYDALGLQENFLTYCQFMFPHAFKKKSPAFHSEIFAEFSGMNNSVVAAPRGHAKSTLIGLGYVSWLIAYKKARYIIYTSQNHAKSTQFMEPLISELRENVMWNFVYGQAKIIGVIEEGKGIHRQDMVDINGIRVQALSFEKNIRGLKYGVHRPTIIILDDIEEDQRVINPELRKKDEDKLNKQIIPSLDTINGRYKMVGTILHYDSLLAKKIRLLNGKIYKAISPTGELLWPEMFSQEKLDAIKYEIGSSAFESEYMNNPIDDTASIIKMEWIKKAFNTSISFGDLGKYDYKVLGVDFAFSDRVTADNSAFVGVGKNADGYTIADCFIKHGMSVTEQMDIIEQTFGTGLYNDSALEENSIISMSKDLRKYNFKYTLFWTGASDARAVIKQSPEFNNKRHTVGKAAIINRLATQFENGRIIIPYKTEADKRIAHRIMDECVTYARQSGEIVETGVHGDIPIALALAIERMEMETFNFSFGTLDLNAET